MISPGNAGVLSGLGYAYAVAGRKAEADKVGDELNELSKQKYVSADEMAWVYTGLGEKNKAFDWLEKAYEERSISTSSTAIKVNPIFDPLRSDPRWIDLLRRMNLQP